MGVEFFAAQSQSRCELRRVVRARRFELLGHRGELVGEVRGARLRFLQLRRALREFRIARRNCGIAFGEQRIATCQGGDALGDRRFAFCERGVARLDGCRQLRNPRLPLGTFGALAFDIGDSLLEFGANCAHRFELTVEACLQRGDTRVARRDHRVACIDIRLEHLDARMQFGFGFGRGRNGQRDERRRHHSRCEARVALG